MRYLIILLIITIAHAAYAQPDGLWVVTELKVGDQLMTPVARWMRFDETGTVWNGNGWTQHSVGKWQYHAANANLSISTDNSPKDEAGPFKIVSQTANAMEWQRREEGNLVYIKLKKATELPQAPADQLIGLWLLSTTEKEATATPQAYVYLRPDRRFNFSGFPTGYTQGIWHVDGHKPLLSLLADGREEQWQIDIQATTMTWTKTSPAGPASVLHFTRTDTFPE